jgi:hypothetical protein
MRKVIVIFLLVCFSCLPTTNKKYLISPDGKKYITFIEHESNTHWYYVIPGKYESRDNPTSNYVIIQWSDVFDFEVNWSRKDKYRFAYPFVVTNKLDSKKVDFSEKLDQEGEVKIENGKSVYKLPQIEGYLIEYIMREEYLAQRKKMYEAAGIKVE